MRTLSRVGWLLWYSLVIPSVSWAQFDTTAWRFAGDSIRVETFAGRTALMLQDALAYLPTAQFRVGTIEFDLNVSNAPGFVGVQFRMQGASDYEDYYFRPMNSGAGPNTLIVAVSEASGGWAVAGAFEATPGVSVSKQNR